MYQFVHYDMARSIQNERRDEAKRIAVARRLRFQRRTGPPGTADGAAAIADASSDRTPGEREAPALVFAPRPSSETRLRRSA